MKVHSLLLVTFLLVYKKNIKNDNVACTTENMGKNVQFQLG